MDHDYHENRQPTTSYTLQIYWVIVNLLHDIVVPLKTAVIQQHFITSGTPREGVIKNSKTLFLTTIHIYSGQKCYLWTKNYILYIIDWLFNQKEKNIHTFLEDLPIYHMSSANFPFPIVIPAFTSISMKSADIISKLTNCYVIWDTRFFTEANIQLA